MDSVPTSYFYQSYCVEKHRGKTSSGYFASLFFLMVAQSVLSFCSHYSGLVRPSPQQDHGLENRAHSTGSVKDIWPSHNIHRRFVA